MSIWFPRQLQIKSHYDPLAASATNPASATQSTTHLRVRWEEVVSVLEWNGTYLCTYLNTVWALKRSLSGVMSSRFKLTDNRFSFVLFPTHNYTQ